MRPWVDEELAAGELLGAVDAAEPFEIARILLVAGVFGFATAFALVTRDLTTLLPLVFGAEAFGRETFALDMMNYWCFGVSVEMTSMEMDSIEMEKY